MPNPNIQHLEFHEPELEWTKTYVEQETRGVEKTPFGRVAVAQYRVRPWHTREEHTGVLGFYKGERRERTPMGVKITLEVLPIPPGNHPNIAEILKQRGYRAKFFFGGSIINIANQNTNDISEDIKITTKITNYNYLN